MLRESRIICQLCGKNRHVAIKCFKRFDVLFTGVISSTTPQAYLTETNSYNQSQEECYYEPPYDPSWYMDSGATNHITYDMNNLSSNTPYHGHDHVAVGNDNQLPITSVGKSTLYSSSFPNSYPLLLNNILYVPQITKNLVSISQFTKDNKVFIEFHHDSCLVKDNHTHQILMKRTLTKGLYQLSNSAITCHNSRTTAFLINTTPSLPSAATTNASSSSIPSHCIHASSSSTTIN